MVDIHVIKGGLGNQMFQYAHYLARKARFPRGFSIFDTHNCRGAHQGFELNHLFHLSAFGLGWILNIENAVLFSKLRKYIWKRMHIYVEKLDWIYDESSVDIPKSCVFEGYWQTEKYFKGIADVVRKEFQFDYHMLNQQSKEIVDEIKRCHSISLHIRRGDYLNIKGKDISLSLDYYKRAIEYITEHVRTPMFFIFSDDPQWVRDNFKVKNAMYVDWNCGKDSWQDMCLMSCCKHNIIANSTFSWWGAWLNANPDKIVISPTWDGDMIPNEWIQLKNGQDE